MPAISVKKELRQRTSSWLVQNFAEVATRVVDEHYARNPRQRSRYGPGGREKCIADVSYHLHFLAEAVAAGSIEEFLRYVGWAKIVLVSRKIDVEDFAATLQGIAPAVAAYVPKEEARVVEKFISTAMKRLPAMPETVPAFIAPASPFAELAKTFLSLLLILHREKAVTLLTTEVEEARLSIRDLFNTVIAPVQREVGRLWQQNEITVLQEHYCTAAIETVIAKVRHQFINAPVRGVSALAVCPAGEQHALGLQMFTDLLDADGWTVSYIGANTPTASVISFLASEPTDLVAISAATDLNMRSVRELIAAIRLLPRAPKVIVGGAALLNDKTKWRDLGADAFGPTVVDGLDAVNRLFRSHTRIAL